MTTPVPELAQGHHPDGDHHHPDGDHHHDRDHDHRQHGDHGLLDRLAHLLRPHGHAPSASTDEALEGSAEGLRAVRRSLMILLATSALQATVVIVSGSVALLADTIHNLADALTAIPLGLAFVLSRRPPTRRFGYGLGRAEDLAGAVVVAMIAGSALMAAGESVRRLSHPAPVQHLVAVALAGVIGFAGNEVVAGYRLRVGRRIGSAALVADGYHARADGVTSLGVVVGAGGVGLGWPLADPLVGLVITAAILVTAVGAARDVGLRLLDGVDPGLVDRVRAVVAELPGVLEVREVRLRWIGHRLHADVALTADEGLSLRAAQRLIDVARAALERDVPHLADAAVRVGPPRRVTAPPGATPPG
jgi:cation diffusion facilitator family transporter